MPEEVKHKEKQAKKEAPNVDSKGGVGDELDGTYWQLNNQKKKRVKSRATSAIASQRVKKRKKITKPKRESGRDIKRPKEAKKKEDSIQFPFQLLQQPEANQIAHQMPLQQGLAQHFPLPTLPTNGGSPVVINIFTTAPSSSLYSPQWPALEKK